MRKVVPHSIRIFAEQGDPRMSDLAEFFFPEFSYAAAVVLRLVLASTRISLAPGRRTVGLTGWAKSLFNFLQSYVQTHPGD
jgi:hypothetical protein